MLAIGLWAYQAKKEEEEQINVVLFVNENYNNNELKRLQSVSRVCKHVESCT
jgi:hypothetical protein